MRKREEMGNEGPVKRYINRKGRERDRYGEWSLRRRYKGIPVYVDSRGS